jgi:hypothetical protein
MRLLRKFLTLAVNDVVITGIRRALGYQQITVTVAVKMTLPTQTVPGIQAGQSGISQQTTQIPCGLAIIQCNGGNVRWRDDGTAPTASVGMTLASGAELDYTGDFANLQFILSSGTPILDISLYGGVA